jgi:hypothetical protein
MQLASTIKSGNYNENKVLLISMLSDKLVILASILLEKIGLDSLIIHSNHLKASLEKRHFSLARAKLQDIESINNLFRKELKQIILLVSRFADNSESNIVLEVNVIPKLTLIVLIGSIIILLFAFSLKDVKIFLMIIIVLVLVFIGLRTYILKYNNDFNAAKTVKKIIESTNKVQSLLNTIDISFKKYSCELIRLKNFVDYLSQIVPNQQSDLLDLVIVID